MAIRVHKPVTSGVRGRVSVSDNRAGSKNRPLRSARRKRKSTGGRNNQGRTTVRFRGGGHKRLYRLVDFFRGKLDVPGRVEGIEYDPNRSAYLARIVYRDGDRRYIPAPEGVKIGDEIVAGKSVEMNVGNAAKLANIPVGSMVHSVELKPGAGGQMVRAAGTFAQILAKESGYASVRLPSGEVRKVLLSCRATIGQVGNIEHSAVRYGKAGRSRWLGFRPHNRGVTMNPVDHPHGGGEGRTSGGRDPVSPWCVPTKGFKTRRNKRTSKFILKRRK